MVDEQDLVRRCRSGDERAFAQLVDEHKAIVFSLIYRTVGSTADANDLAQEVFLRVYRGLPTFRGQSKISTWIYQIANRVCLHALQQPGHRYSHVEFDEVAEYIETADGSTPRQQDALARVELCDTVATLLDSLQPHHRAVLVWYYLQERSYEEIAQIMELPMGTVKTYLHRAKKSLRQRMREEGEN